MDSPLPRPHPIGRGDGVIGVCYFRAPQIGDVVRLAPLDQLSAVLGVACGVAFLGDKPAAINWLGVVLIATGAWLVTLRM